MTSALVLLSGGVDSTTMLWQAVKGGAYERVVTLGFDYGQRHRREIERAHTLAAMIGVPFFIGGFAYPEAPAPNVSTLLAASHDQPPDAQEGHIARNVVPGRNALFLTMAAAFASMHRLDDVLIGVVKDDYADFPDCRPLFLEAMELALRLGYKAPRRIVAPLIDMDKKQIIELGLSLEVPYEATWTCYRGEIDPCMRCDSCTLRRESFAYWGRDYWGRARPKE